MVNDFFLGFAGHAHTKNDLIVDPNIEIELRKRNSPEEAQRLTKAVLDKLEKDISNAGYDLKDVKLLILYLSYRGETEEKDRLICEKILGVIEGRFKGHTAQNQLRLIGHTTAGEVENEDLELKEVSGIGYNGVSILALVSSVPIGVGRTWGLRTEREAVAVEQGKEMAHDAWVDFNQRTDIKEHVQKSKTLFVLTQGPKTVWEVGIGYEHFLAEGIANFMGSTREARILNVIGGCSGDGVLGMLIHQFYGRLGEKSELKILDNEAVCALIPNLSEPSIGIDAAPVKRIGTSHMFHFDPEKKPQFKYIKRIGNKDPREVYAKILHENEARISRERGLPVLDEKELFKIISEFEVLPFHPICGKYALAFPFGNYAPVVPMRASGQTMELNRPVRCHEPMMTGYVVEIDCEKVQKGGRNVHNMLRENRCFAEKDVTLLVPCFVRRAVEIMAGSTSKTEAEILKEALSSTQVIGFLAYGELSFTHLLQEPYVWNYSCWGITLRSVTNGREERKRKISEVQQFTEEARRVAEERAKKKYELVYRDLLKEYPRIQRRECRVAIAQIGVSKTGDILSEFYEEKATGLLGLREDKVETVRSKVKNMIEIAHSKGVNILLFPELTVDLNYGQLLEDIASLAKAYEMYIIPGSYHDQETKQNISVVVGPDGILWQQEKHIPATISHEGKKFKEGIEVGTTPRKTIVCNTEFGRIAIAICRDFLDMDLRVELKNFEPPVDIIFNPAFTPVTADFKAAHFDARRSIYAYCFFANVAEFGDSLIYTPEKERVERTVPPGEENLIYKDIDLFKLRSERRKWEKEQGKERQFIQSTR